MIDSKFYNNVKIGKNVVIEPFCIIGIPPKGVKDGEYETIIGDNSIIRSHSDIYSGNKIGKNFQTGHHVIIRENNIIGDDCALGSFSEIAFDVKMGDNVKIHSNCFIFEGTMIEDDVKLNPGVFVLNTKFPFRPGHKPEIEPVIIRKGARITARVTLMPGVVIGKYALIGAGSLVTKDVPEYAVAYGHPATIKGDIRDIKDKDGNTQYKVE